MNVATANQARFSALLVESDNKGGLEGALREQGCTVRRATTRAAAHEALEGTDIIVISSGGFSDEDVLDLIGKAQGRQVLVVAESQDLAVKAAKQGAIVAGSFELASAQLTGLLTIVDLKRKVRTAGPVSLTSPTSGRKRRRTRSTLSSRPPSASSRCTASSVCTSTTRSVVSAGTRSIRPRLSASIAVRSSVGHVPAPSRRRRVRARSRRPRPDRDRVNAGPGASARRAACILSS